MNILLISEDLYHKTGGGQTVYKKIIEANPQHNFFYYINEESKFSKRPKNVKAIKLKCKNKINTNIPVNIEEFKIADQYAKSTPSNVYFDVVDIPDYLTCGSYLPTCFNRYNIKVRRFVLALHGTLVKSLLYNYKKNSNVSSTKKLEHSLFNSFSSGYSISERYTKEVQKKYNINVISIDPNLLIGNFHLKNKHEECDKLPDLYCIGRTEKRKGNDLFIELQMWLDKTKYNRAIHIGDEYITDDKISSFKILTDMTISRDIRNIFESSKNHAQLKEIYKQNVIVILPVRYDTFNLVALEAIFSGCPIIVSSQAGVCDYLDKNFPELPYLKIDIMNITEAANYANEYIKNYKITKEKLNQALNKYKNSLKLDLSLSEIYNKLDTILPNNRFLNIPYKTSISFFEKSKKIPFLIFNKVFTYAIKHKYDLSFLHCVFKYIHSIKHYKKTIKSKEFSTRNIYLKIKKIKSVYPNKLFRATSFYCFSNLYRSLGKIQLAVTYELRILRLLNDDRFAILNRCVSSLNHLGFIAEAEATNLMFSDSETKDEKISNFLHQKFRNHLQYASKPLEFSFDYRKKTIHKISIIVSLYNAEDKLLKFLNYLLQQNYIKSHEAEIILIDSGSPSNEFQVFRKFVESNDIEILYARSKGRETIQAAWNRGINLSNSPYLVFLGVDETIYPSALEILSKELDTNPDIDWVMSNSIVTEVEQSGLHIRDVMKYNRNEAFKDLACLETCYISWVGGMYRRSIHERFGFYDESFRAAGDTEFKNRILPYIKVKFINQTLGLFLNYPDGQTTASSIAEIEDMRAWYIYRTYGGVKYTHSSKTNEEIEDLLRFCFSYRKSYATHKSCDLEYATHLLKILISRERNKEKNYRLLNCTISIIDYFKIIEIFPNTKKARFFFLWSFLQLMLNRKLNFQAKRYLGISKIPQSFHDNRFEQHSFLWK